MNNITIAGNITKDCELKYTPNGDAVSTFNVADNQGKDKDAIFWRCQLWGKRAESLKDYLTKGQSVTITGSISESKYTDKDGIDRKSMDIRVNDVALQGGQRQQQAAPKPASQREQNRDRQYNQSRPAPQFSDFNDDVPFAPLMARKALAV